MTAPQLNLSMIGNLNHLGSIREQIRDFARRCRFSKEAIDEIELAVDEAVANVILHAYAPAQEGLVEIRAHLVNQAMAIVIRDFGRSYSPRPITASEIRRICASRKNHGRGRYIMHQCMDSVDYVSVPRQYNETVMVKKVKKNS